MILFLVQSLAIHSVGPPQLYAPRAQEIAVSIAIGFDSSERVS